MGIAWNRLKKYRGMWVAVYQDRVVASGRSLKEVMDAALKVCKRPEVFQIPEEEEVYILWTL
ncbi:MAG: DUF5678 domain-containing protein [Candidatus Hydrothermarchaeales archaeon]